MPTAADAFKRGTVSIQKRKTKDGTTTYLARYRAPDGSHRGKTFSKRGLAVSWLAEQEVEHRSGTWVDPNAGKIRFGAWVAQWTPTYGNHLRESSKGNDAALLRARVLPRWRNVALRDITHIEVNRWVGDLCNELAPSSVHKVVSLFNKVLADARRSRLIAHNPCDGVRLPKIEKRELRIPTAQEVARLADAIDGRYRAFVLLAAYTGLRFGEIAGLRWGRVDLLRGRLDVLETAGEDQNGVLAFNLHAKTDAGRRSVPIPKFVGEELSKLTGPNPDPHSLVFTSVRGQALRRSTFRRRVWLPARTLAGLDDLTPHDLRHFAISLWILHGANVIQAKTLAGHSRVSVTIDTYGHLFPEAEDTLTPKLDQIGRAAQSVSWS